MKQNWFFLKIGLPLLAVGSFVSPRTQAGVGAAYVYQDENPYTGEESGDWYYRFGWQDYSTPANAAIDYWFNSEDDFQVWYWDNYWYYDPSCPSYAQSCY